MSEPSEFDADPLAVRPRPIDRLVQLWDDMLADRLPAVLSAMVVAIVCGGLAFIAFRPQSEPAPVELQLPLATPLPVTPVPEAPLVVHVAGAVREPGLYDVPAATRVADAIDLAGGATASADLDRVNLAAPVIDGERLWIPAVGETAPPPVEGMEVADAGPVSLNAATAAQLDDLPGVGPTTAGAIVDHREREGPFATIDDLLDVSGIGPAKLEQIRPLVSL